MDSMPIWPPLLALALGWIGYLIARWDSKRFDERMKRRREARMSGAQTEH